LGDADPDLGGEGLDTSGEGNFSTYIDTTDPSAIVRNITTSESATDAAVTLQANGFTLADTSGPSTTYMAEDGSYYVIRPSGSAPGGWAADYYPAGSPTTPTLKINFSNP
jgi:hypothetical protein